MPLGIKILDLPFTQMRKYKSRKKRKGGKGGTFIDGGKGKDTIGRKFRGKRKGAGPGRTLLFGRR